MNSKELQLIVKCGETSTVQFKERFSNQDSIAAEMVAMSNARGGMIHNRRSFYSCCSY